MGISFAFQGTNTGNVSVKLAALEQKVVDLKVATYPEYVRIVFVASEDAVQKAQVSRTDKNIISVEFISQIVIVYERGVFRNDLPLEIVSGVRTLVKDNIVKLTFDNLSDFKVFRLSSPFRLVIDAYQAQSASTLIPPAQKAVPPDSQETAEPAFIVIDPGHGGYDKGIRGSHFIEKDFVLSFVRDLSSALAKKGRKVVLTRKSDQTLSLKERSKPLQKRQTTLLISIHLSLRDEIIIYTASGGEAIASGHSPSRNMSVASRDTSKKLAYSIIENIKNDLNINIRYEELPISVLSTRVAPGVLMELPNPDKFTYDVKTKEKIINALVKGIIPFAKTQ